MEIAAVMDNVTTLNSFRDKQTVSKAYKKADIKIHSILWKVEGMAGAEAATNEQQKGAERVMVPKAEEGQEALAPQWLQSSWQAGYKHQAVGGPKMIVLPSCALQTPDWQGWKVTLWRSC